MKILFDIEDQKFWSIICNAYIGVMENGMSDWFGNASTNMSDWGDPTCWNENVEITVNYDSGDDEEGSFASKKLIKFSDIKLGVELMSKDYSRHFRDLIEENDDAITHDVLWQLIILGDIVYG